MGAQKLEYNNFFSYNPSGKTWATFLKTQPGLYNKAWKDGSCIRKIGNKIYAAKGGDKYNAFWVYDIGTNNWDEIESCPQNHPNLGKKNKFGDGTAICTDGSVIYLIKGKGKQDFWMYTPSSKGLWTGLCTIPRYGINYKKSVPKTGASLAYAGSRVWLIKGNKLNEFWQYVPEEKSKIKYQISNISPAIQSNPTPILEFHLDVKPNPFTRFTTINYNVPVSGKALIKLYNASGILIKTLVDEYLNAGSYAISLSDKHLTKGVYFLRYEHNTNTKEIKLILQ
ncbi:MAG: T9SS type A sorting domain-containing protein [candidate division WOR-3 bacterium]|nr:T9SS type A sorting domain-containing protein [candidate division WOR-3 bacterium]